jgi:conjugal transfer pilus assembly protein TraW
MGYKKIAMIGYLIFFSAMGKDLGNFGATFEIIEPNFLEQIYAQLNSLRDSKKLETAEKDIQKIMEEKIKNPRAVVGLQRTKISRIFQFDPTIEVTRDLKDHSGKVFAKKGERFNPLDHIQMTKVILFFDGDDENQIRWAISKPQSKCLILVRGSPLELQKRFDQPIYFDQHGAITSKLGIKQVPAMARQEKKFLVITEEKP